MVRQVGKMLTGIRWNESLVARFLGEYLTEPKSNVWFAPPDDALGIDQFKRHAKRIGVRLHRKTRMLYRDDNLFVNGESLQVPKSVQPEVRQLADARCLKSITTRSTWWTKTLHDWYCAGYVEFDQR
jgi:50S ribosomal protein L16 3-hydroxylase